VANLLILIVILIGLVN